MTKADLVERVTAQISRTAGPMISKKDCARVVDAFLDAIKEALQAQKNIEVRGFGTFKIRHRKTRMARNPRTGSPVEVSARPVPVFKPSKELRAMVAGVDIHELERRERKCRRRKQLRAAVQPGSMPSRHRAVFVFRKSMSAQYPSRRPMTVTVLLFASYADALGTELASARAAGRRDRGRRRRRAFASCRCRRDCRRAARRGESSVREA